MATKKKEEKKGKLTPNEINALLNKKSGSHIAFSLEGDNPALVKDWIPTGSRWLDSMIAKGRYGGIPVGKIVEIAGLEGSGKSYMAAQIAVQAQKKGIHVVYFDSESSIDPEFLSKIGIDLSQFTYVQATSVESVFKNIDEILANSDGVRYLFIWDSFANTPSESDVADDEYNPQSTMAKIPRIASLGMRKLTVPIANAESTLLVLNQLKTNIGDNAKIEPWFTPGGKALQYAYSLRIWLTKKKAKDSYVINDANGFRVGSEVKIKLYKSRFGTEGRECIFKIIWGQDPVGIQDEESWLDAIRGSDRLITAGAWKTLILNDKTEVKFQEGMWKEKLQDPNFKTSVISIMDEEVIQKFEKKIGNAKDFYNLFPDENISNETEDSDENEEEE